LVNKLVLYRQTVRVPTRSPEHHHQSSRPGQSF
jgi:hypothetical protein